VYSWRDGRVWLGQWKDGEPHGRFIQYGADKTVERMGIFHKGKLQSAKLVDPKAFTRIAAEVLAATRPAPAAQTGPAAATAVDVLRIDDWNWDDRYPPP
jgi:hypothetical protein